MSFAERVEQRRAQRDRKAHQERLAEIAQATSPVMVARMSRYKTALEGLAEDLSGSAEFRELFGNDRPVVAIALPGEPYRDIVGGFPRVEKTAHPTQTVVAMTCSGQSGPDGSRPQYLLSVMIVPTYPADGIDCRVRIFGANEEEYDADLRDDLFHECDDTKLPAETAPQLVAALDDYLVEFVLRMQPSRAPAAPAQQAHEVRDSGPGIMGRIFGR